MAALLLCCLYLSSAAPAILSRSHQRRTSDKTEQLLAFDLGRHSSPWPQVRPTAASVTGRAASLCRLFPPVCSPPPSSSFIPEVFASRRNCCLAGASTREKRQDVADSEVQACDITKCWFTEPVRFYQSDSLKRKNEPEG